MFVIVNEETKSKVRFPKTGTEYYSTKAAAQAALTRLNKKRAQGLSTFAYPSNQSLVVMGLAEYQAQLPMKTVVNLMSGQEIQIAADTPACCDPSTETYWSM